MLPVAVHVPVAGSCSSALLKKPPPFHPPATSTLPEDSSVALWFSRPVTRLPVRVQLPAVGWRYSGGEESATLACKRMALSRRNGKIVTRLTKIPGDGERQFCLVLFTLF